MSATGYATEFAPGDMLSPSQGKTFLQCSAKWAFKHYLKLPDPKTGALLQGSALHDAVGENMAQKLETRKDLPMLGAIALYRNSWEAQRDETEFRDDESEPDLKAEGEDLVRRYMDDVAPTIDPAAVELPVNGTIGGVAVRGYIDLLDVDGRVIDLKSKKQKPSKVDFNDRFQVATYRALTPHASGAARVDVLVKTAAPQLVQLEFAVDQADLTMVERLYPQVQAGIRGQVFVPNRGSNLCSRKYCGYWRACEREFGGHVAE